MTIFIENTLIKQSHFPVLKKSHTLNTKPVFYESKRRQKNKRKIHPKNLE